MSHGNSGSETWKYPQRAKFLNLSITKVNYFSKILQKTLLEFMFSWVSTYVTHFRPIVSFDTSWKYQKISPVLIFPGSKKQNILLKYLCPDPHELFQLDDRFLKSFIIYWEISLKIYQPNWKLTHSWPMFSMIYKPAKWFAMQINQLVSIWWGTLVVNVLMIN